VENISEPLGLDIGAETQEENTVNIVTEFIETRRLGRTQKAF